MEFKNTTSDFMTELLKLCLTDKDFIHLTMEHLSIHNIPDERYKSLYIYLVKYVTENSYLPSPATISMKYRLDSEMTNLLVELKEPSFQDKEKTVKEFEAYVRQLKFIEYINKCTDTFNLGSHEDAYMHAASYDKIMESVNFAKSNAANLFDDFEKRQEERKTQKANTAIPFGIDALDKITGGAKTGEYHLFLGDSGIGKSQLLIHLGLSAARAGYKVAHFSAEGSRRQTLDRYDAAWTNTKYKNVQIGDIDTVEARSFLKAIRERGASEIFVECYEQFGSATLMNVKRRLSHYCRLHTDLKVLVLDYLELFEPPIRSQDERHRQTAISKMLKDLALEFDIVVYSATQASSISNVDKNDVNFVLTRYNLSEDKGKVRPADGLYTLNRTAEEYEQKIVRIYIDKRREGKSGQIIPIITDYSKSIFYDKHATLQRYNIDAYGELPPAEQVKGRQKPVKDIKKEIVTAEFTPYNSDDDDIPF